MGRTKKDKTLKSNEEKTISYLLRKARLKGVTQTEIAKEIEVSQPTVSSFIDGLCGITRSYRGVKYEIKKIGGKYIAFNEEYLSAHSSAGKKLSQTRKEPKNNNIQNDKINEVTAIDKLEREYSAYFYAYPARTADKAIRLTRSVVAFPVVQRMRKEVIARIRSSFGEECFNDIVPYKQGVYIILVESKCKNSVNDSRLDELFEQLNNLYCDLPRSYSTYHQE